MPKFLLIGAGDRGRTYAKWLKAHPEAGRIVAVAEPVDHLRQAIAEDWGLSGDALMSDWRQAAAGERCADAALICTQDHLHEEPAIALAERGYHLLLEKPLAPTAEACQRIATAVRRAGVLFSVCHVLRYAPATRAIQNIIRAGEIGEVVSVQRLEPIGFWHFAHAFVRGHWARSADSSPILLSKTCHDIDWIHAIIGQDCHQVQSFGGLQHFRPERRPAGAAQRCLDCAVADDCPYSAQRIYLDRLNRGEDWWPVDTVVANPTTDSLTAALRDGPYGACVYNGDNDVMDHQVLNMQFVGGATASLTLTAFTPHESRHSRIFGSLGMISETPQGIEVFNFLENKSRKVDVVIDEIGHHSADDGMLRAFCEAVRQNDHAPLLAGLDESLASHLSVFAGEESRINGTVVTLDPPSK